MVTQYGIKHVNPDIRNDILTFAMQFNTQSAHSDQHLYTYTQQQQYIVTIASLISTSHLISFTMVYSMLKLLRTYIGIHEACPGYMPNNTCLHALSYIHIMGHSVE